MTRSDMIDFVDTHDPDWYYKWCETEEGSWEELEIKFNELWMKHGKPSRQEGDADSPQHP